MRGKRAYAPRDKPSFRARGLSAIEEGENTQTSAGTVARHDGPEGPVKRTALAQKRWSV